VERAGKELRFEIHNFETIAMFENIASFPSKFGTRALSEANYPAKQFGEMN